MCRSILILANSLSFPSWLNISVLPLLGFCLSLSSFNSSYKTTRDFFIANLTGSYLIDKHMSTSSIYQPVGSNAWAPGSSAWGNKDVAGVALGILADHFDLDADVVLNVCSACALRLICDLELFLTQEAF